MHTWRVDTTAQTIALASDGGVPWVSYWGPPLPKSEDLEALAKTGQLDFTGGMLDGIAPLSLCPEAATGFAGQPGLMAYRDGKLLQTRLRFMSADRFSKGDESDDTLRITVGDDDLTVVFVFHTRGPMIEASTQLTTSKPVLLHRLAAPVLPVPEGCTEVSDVAGKWVGEWRVHRSDIRHGIHMREARQGRSGHDHPPFAILHDPALSNTDGVAYSMAYAWSGGHRMIIEALPDGRRQVQWGHADGSARIGTEFATAPLVLIAGTAGYNSVSVPMQRHVRETLVPWVKRDRPVHYNCWEAVYFNHDFEVLREIADRAAALGAERFVLDDGWFGLRDDDTSGLGDWQIDPRKWPAGLKPLIDHVRKLGMGFGLWFEPEMINLNSDLARARPDWILGAMDQLEGRQQRVLDLSRLDVREYIVNQISKLLSNNEIEYIKWDHNRVLPVSDAAQTYGIYDVFARLRAAHPKVEIENCSSGGGRIDLGMMEFTQRVWLSDSNDAVERARIQHDSALFLPCAITGSHVGPRICHTSGRKLNIKLRAWTAAQRHMGFEMDPRELTDDEAESLTLITAWWKENRSWMMGADILRLDTEDAAVLAEQQISAEGDRFVVFRTQISNSTQISPRLLRLTGLEPDAVYEINLLNKADGSHLSRGALELKNGPVRLTGQSLTARGVALPWAFPETIWVLEGRKI